MLNRIAWVVVALSIPLAVLAQEVIKPEYVIVFVPVAWSGTMDEFDRAADEQAEYFIERSEIERFADVKVVTLHDNLIGVSLDDPNLPAKAMRSALSQEPGDRYIGLTDGDLELDGSSDVVGWTQLGGTAVICESSDSVVTAHELGHTYNLCDEYNYSYWLRQNRQLGECPNPYPPDCPKDKGDTVICEGMPAEDGSPSIMGPAMGVEQKYNRPSLEHLQVVFEAMLGTPVVPTPTLEPGVTPSPTSTPRPSPTPIPTPRSRTMVVSSGDNGPVNLYVIQPDETKPKQITTGPGPDVHGAWSPDGSQIVYVSGMKGSLSLYLLSLQDRVPMLLSSGGQSTHPAWSPSGDSIAFASDRDGDWDIYTIRPDGSDLRNLTDSPDHEDWPDWSSSGDLLAFASDFSGDWEIYYSAYVSADNALAMPWFRLTRSAGRDVMPTWSPDGQRLAFVSERDGLLQVYVMPATADELARVTLNQFNDWGPTWIDDKTLCFQSFRDEELTLYTAGLRDRAERQISVRLQNATWPAVGRP